MGMWNLNDKFWISVNFLLIHCKAKCPKPGGPQASHWLVKSFAAGRAFVSLAYRRLVGVGAHAGIVS